MIKTRTLIEMAALRPAHVLLTETLERFARYSDILRVIPFIEEPTSEYLGGIGVDHLYIAGGDLDTDSETLAQHGADVRLAHDMRKVKALAHTITDAIINGDSLINERCFDGLRVRIPKEQCIHPAGALQTGHLRALLAMVKNPTHLIMPAVLRSLLTAAATDPEIGKYITLGMDEFGRRVTLFDGVPILMSGVNAYNQQIIDFRDEPDGASVYAVNLSAEGVAGLQNGIMDVYDKGEVKSPSPVFRTRVEWVIGLTFAHMSAASRLLGVRNERVTA